MKVVKRDGTIVKYDVSKIKNAICKAISVTYPGISEDRIINMSGYYTSRVDDILKSTYNNVDKVSVEAIQDIVEDVLIKDGSTEVAKEYILYRNKRSNVREMNSNLMSTMKDMFKDSKHVDLKRENGNIDGDTSMGTMLRIGSEASKQFYKMNMIRPEISKAHDDGDIHIHDLDFYGLTETCCQIDISKLFKDGFSTGHGFLREPSNIITAAALTCIAIQANQNDQHGGQSIPALDFMLAPYVAKSFIKNICKVMDIIGTGTDQVENARNCLNYIYDKHGTLIGDIAHNDVIYAINSNWVTEEETERVYKKSLEYTEKDCFQAMEALVHNLNSMHSRAGAQVPFSSLNYGTDTSQEGRMVTKSILDALWAGLGNGETPIFPIHIFKEKEGVNYNPGDPNYDLWKLACKVSAKRLFPNFSNLDAPYNLQYYKPNCPESEVTYMGCRTRVMGNVYDPSREIAFGRGNLSFTSINLPRIAIEAIKMCEDSYLEYDRAIGFFYDILDKRMNLVFEQLLDRFEIQAKRKVKNYPFLMGQGIWIDSDKLGPEDEIRDIIKHGSLSTGFIGLAEALKMLLGYHHGESEVSKKLGFEIITHMREMCDKKAEETGLNFTLLATPAEGLSGRFVKIDRKKYGTIPGVTDRDYYTNSFHVPVYYPIDAYHKIHIEAPYHALCNAGHISYVEMDGDPLQNLDAFEDIVRLMHDEGIGYGSINHAVDRCTVCGYTGVIGDKCPRCGNNGIDPVSVDLLKELKKKYNDIHIPECCK